MTMHSPTMTLALSGAADVISLPGIRLRGQVPGREALEAALGLGPLVFGSSADCDLVLDDPSVSRRHGEVRLTPRGILLRDLGSKNGTRIAGVRAVEAFVAPDTDVMVGRAVVSVQVHGTPTTISLSPRALFGGARGASVVMRALFDRLERASLSNETVLLLGESGTGKELLARGVHDASTRREKPFVVFDCSAVSPALIESELFGHARGAFTGAAGARVGLFEEAHGGTLFIDEIGELPLDLQPKLLRVLETRKVRPVGSNETRAADVRVVAATHRDLRAKVAAGTFRADLYYRLAVVPLEVPPLRERKEDIPLLVEHFLAERDPPCTLSALPPHALELLASHNWPGNVRELRNAVARLVLFPDLGRSAIEPAGSAGGADGVPLHLPLREARALVVEAFEQRYLSAQLAAHNGNVAAAARAMGVSRQFAHRMLIEHGLRSPSDD